MNSGMHMKDLSPEMVKLAYGIRAYRGTASWAIERLNEMENETAKLKEELVAMQEVVDGLKKKCRHLTDLAEGERDSAAYWRQFYKKKLSETYPWRIS